MNNDSGGSERRRITYAGRGALRVQQITIFKPDALSSGLEYQAITQAMTMNLEECNLFGGGTINLLVEMDAANETARIGTPLKRVSTSTSGRRMRRRGVRSLRERRTTSNSRSCHCAWR